MAQPSVEPAPKIEAKYIEFLNPRFCRIFTDKIFEKNLTNLLIDKIKPIQNALSMPKKDSISKKS